MVKSAGKSMLSGQGNPSYAPALIASGFKAQCTVEFWIGINVEGPCVRETRSRPLLLFTVVDVGKPRATA